MASATPQPGFVPRVNASGSGLEYVSVAEMLLAVSANTQPNPADPLWRIWIDTSAVPGGSQSTDHLTESVTVTETRVTVLAALESRVESSTPAESESDAVASAGAWSESRNETVTVTETRTDLVALTEVRTETVTTTESEADSVTAGAVDISLVDWTTSVYGANTGSITPTLPSGSTGDLLVAVFGGGSPGVASGWTEKRNEGTVAVYYRRATGSDSLSLATGSLAGAVIVARYSGCLAAGDPFEAMTYNINSSGHSVTTSAVTTTVAKDWLLLASGFYDSDSYGDNVPTVSWNAPTGAGSSMTTTVAGTYSTSAAAGGAGVGLWSSVKTVAGSSGTATNSYNGSEDSPAIGSILLALKHQ